MTAETIDGKDCLFIEVGGFDAKLGADWNAPLLVMKRDGK